MADPQVLLLNGIPGSGKSTIARTWAAGRTARQVIDIDLLRAQLPDWQADPITAGLRARELTLQQTRQHLLLGREVIIPQFLGKVGFLDQLNQLCRECVVPLHELAIVDALEDSITRFNQRPLADPSSTHAAAEIVAAGGRRALAEAAENLANVIAQRPQTLVLHTYAGNPQRTADELDQLVRRTR